MPPRLRYTVARDLPVSSHAFFTPVTNQGEIPIDEMAQLVYQHTGEGDIIADQPDEPRPSYQEVHDTLTHGKATPLKGQNSVRYDYHGVRVIVNLDAPVRSTSY